MNASKSRPLTVTSWTSVWRRFRMLRPRRARNSIKTSPTLPCLKTRKIIQICCFYRTIIVKITTVIRLIKKLAPKIQSLKPQIKTNKMIWPCNQIAYSVQRVISRGIQILSLRRKNKRERAFSRIQKLICQTLERGAVEKKANARFSDLSIQSKR